MRLRLRVPVLLFLALFVATAAFAQTTSQLTGTVSSGGSPTPGVSVTISSPALQGTRTAVTGDGGGYNFAALPPGEYTVQFELSGMQTVTQRTRLNLSQTSRVDADMRVSGVAETLTVTAAAPSVLETPQVATTLTLAEVERLPVPRNQLATALLAPGVNGNTVSASQLQISGSPGYDNLVLVNGVVVTENVRSQMRPLYIEDAIQETTVLTGAISAEYGRFTGGVVNTITKSGGNDFHGSLRDNLSDPSWTNATAFVSATGVADTRPTSTLNQTWEATLGGFILRDRLWFFTAGRQATTDTPLQQLSIPARTTAPISAASPNITFSQGNEERRLEGKLTAAITAKHTIVGSYLDVASESTNTRFTASSYDLASLTDRSDPESLLSAHYNGMITSNLLLEGQYSRREQAFIGSGAKFTDIVQGTLLLDRNNANARFNSATFCGVCDTETRNNDQFAIKSNYFLNTRATGTHSFVAGIDRFQEQRYANNHQSGSDFRLLVTRTQYANGQIYPVITPTTATGAGTFIRWTPIFVGANENNLRTDSAFINDKWDFSDHFSFNIGIRYDKNKSQDANGFVASDDSKITPRLTAIYDVKGNGRHRVSLAYNEYASRVLEGIASSNASAGQPATIDFVYSGPSFNTTALDTPMADVIRQVFQYFNTTQGGTANTSVANLVQGGLRAIPGYAAYYEGGLVSPYVQEWNLGYGMQIGTTGFLKLDVISRDWHNFYTNEITTATRRTSTPLGINVDLPLVTNSDSVKREYRGFQVQGRWNPSRFQTGLNYTYSTLKGNAEVEDANSGAGAIQDPDNYYPEYYAYEQRLPFGYLNGDQRHRLRAWLGYELPIPAAIGRVNLSLLQNFDSGTPYSASALTNVRTYPGAPASLASLPYNAPRTTGTYFFSDRGEYRFEDATSTSLAVRYSRGLFGGAEFFAQGDLLNIFDEQAVITNVRTTVDTSVTSGGAGLAAFDPFTGTPVEGTNYRLATDFGAPLSRASYQQPRTYRFSLGIRF